MACRVREKRREHKPINGKCGACVGLCGGERRRGTGNRQQANMHIPTRADAKAPSGLLAAFGPDGRQPQSGESRGQVGRVSPAYLDVVRTTTSASSVSSLGIG